MTVNRRSTVGRQSQQLTDSWPTGFLGSSSSQLPKGWGGKGEIGWEDIGHVIVHYQVTMCALM